MQRKHVLKLQPGDQIRIRHGYVNREDRDLEATIATVVATDVRPAPRYYGSGSDTFTTPDGQEVRGVSKSANPDGTVIVARLVKKTVHVSHSDTWVAIDKAPLVVDFRAIVSKWDPKTEEEFVTNRREVYAARTDRSRREAERKLAIQDALHAGADTIRKLTGKHVPHYQKFSTIEVARLIQAAYDKGHADALAETDVVS